MTVLPKVNYLFTMLPTEPTKKWFHNLDMLTSKLYWRNKKPMIKRTILQKDKKKGGLGAPNFRFYYLANQLHYLVKWRQTDDDCNPWLDVEQSYCNEISIADLPFLSKSIKYHECFKSMTISTTLKAWWKINKLTNFEMTPNIYTPIWHNPDFVPLYTRSGKKKA